MVTCQLDHEWSLSHLLGAHGAVVGSDAGAGGLLDRGDQGVVLEVEPLQVFQGGETNWKLLEPVGVEVQVSQALELAEVFRQLLQHVLAQIQLHQVGQSRKSVLKAKATFRLPKENCTISKKARYEAINFLST